jgi:hypothetical protein
MPSSVFSVKAASSALRASSGSEREHGGRDAVAATMLTLTQGKSLKEAWKENGKALLQIGPDITR